MSFVEPRGLFARDSRNLLLKNFDTGRIITEFVPKKKIVESKQEKITYSFLIWDAYALDNNRIVIGFLGSVGIWNVKTDKFTLYKGKGSFESGYGIQVSGVHPDEHLIISCRSYPDEGLYLHDLQKNSTTHLFKEYSVLSPRFSPEGSRYAFYGTLGRHTKDAKSYLIIQSLSSEKRYIYEFQEKQNGINLSWAPSGNYIAGIGRNAAATSFLYIWSNTGKLIAYFPLSFFAHSSWPPLWLQDEKGILVFYKKHFEKKDENIQKHKFTLRPIDFFGSTRWNWQDTN